MVTEICPDCFSTNLSYIDDYVECLNCGAQIELDELDEVDEEFEDEDIDEEDY